MSQRRSKLFRAIGLVAIGVACVFLWKRSPFKGPASGGAETHAILKVAPSNNVSVQNPTLNLVANQPQAATVKGSEDVAHEKVPSEANPPEPGREGDLSKYSLVREKVFLSEAEKTWKRRLLQNGPFLRDLKVILLQPIEAGSEGWSQQKAALDLLFEALTAGDKSVAEGVLAEVVKDRTIEDSSLPQEARRNLAGVKAEVLFQWSALQPTKAGEIASWLPGPVSTKIWDNVVDEQRNNLAESALEAAR